MLWKFYELKNQRRQTRKDVKKAFILVSQIPSPLISSSCNFPCSAKNELYPNHSWKMLVSSSDFSHFYNALFHSTEQSWTRKTRVLHRETKLPQEGTWCISGTWQQLGWNQTSLLAHKGWELGLTAADSLWKSSSAGSHCSLTQTLPQATISHHLHPGNREFVILFSYCFHFFSAMPYFPMSNQG